MPGLSQREQRKTLWRCCRLDHSSYWYLEVFLDVMSLSDVDIMDWLMGEQEWMQCQIKDCGIHCVVILGRAV